jgi:hypothetical protein
MKYAILMACLFMSTIVYAGKVEREKIKELEPILVSSQSTFKAACGCEFKWDIKWDSYKAADDMNRIPSTAERISAGAKEHCTDAESKKAICQLKVISLSYAKDSKGDVTFSGGKISGQTNDTMYVGWDKIVEVLDK